MGKSAASARFIPAGAGNTDVLLKSSRPAPVYPRWRGEHMPREPGATGEIGLSPLARGTLSPKGAQGPFQRFIPAGAGNTCRKTNYDYSISVYPRWRGEHYDSEPRGADICGLSPLARGTLKPDLPDGQATRFIPAGAGNTVRLWRVTRMQGVYPRWRGEHGSAN